MVSQAMSEPERTNPPDHPERACDRSCGAGPYYAIRPVSRALGPLHIPQPLRDDFYAGRRSQVLPLAVNDSVRVKDGRRAGETAAVISRMSAGLALSFLV